MRRGDGFRAAAGAPAVDPDVWPPMNTHRDGRSPRPRRTGRAHDDHPFAKRRRRLQRCNAHVPTLAWHPVLMKKDSAVRALLALSLTANAGDEAQSLGLGCQGRRRAGCSCAEDTAQDLRRPVCAHLGLPVTSHARWVRAKKSRSDAGVAVLSWQPPVGRDWVACR